MKHIPRFFYDGEIQSGSLIKLPDLNGYHLLHVLRAKQGDNLKLFNPSYGEWSCSCEIRKRSVFAKVEYKTRDSVKENHTVSLCFPIIGSQRLSIIFEKCTELGVTNFIPIISDFSQHSNVDKAKATRIFISASEQSGRLDIPKISDPIKLENLFNVDADLFLIFDCTGEYINSSNIFSNRVYKNICVVVGPEGGFSEREISIFKNNTAENVRIIRCCNNVMRSETACIIASCISSIIS